MSGRVARHWSLEPQGFLRQVIRAILPLGKGALLDTYAGSGSTLAAAALRYRAVGVELSFDVAAMANVAIPALREISSMNGNGNGSANGRPGLPDPSALP